MTTIGLAMPVKGNALARPSRVPVNRIPGAGSPVEQLAMPGAPDIPTIPQSTFGFPPQGLIMALVMLNQLEASLGKEFDERMKILSGVGKAVRTTAGALANLGKQSVAQNVNNVFTLPVANDKVSIEGATYEPGKTIFAGETDSRVAAVVRVQWIVGVDPTVLTDLPQPVFGSANVRIMVPGGFVYLLKNDSAGFIVQAPVVPKVEFGVGLEEEGEVMKQLRAEIKGETEFESTFFWLQNPPFGGYRYLSAVVNLFNQAMDMSAASAVKLALQSCARGETAVDPNGRASSRSNAWGPKTVPVVPQN
jgi:hypothetical protein